MDIIQAEFNDYQLIEIAEMAEAKGMTVEEFVEMATRKYVADVKDHAKERLKPDLKIIK